MYFCAEKCFLRKAIHTKICQKTGWNFSSWKLPLQRKLLTSSSAFIFRLFESRPEAKQLFVPFRHLSSEDMKHSTLLRAHALRVMGTVEKCLARIEEPEKLDELLHTLGRKHSSYNVKSEFVDVSWHLREGGCDKAVDMCTCLLCHFQREN